MNPDFSHALPYLLPLLIIVLVLRRSLRQRKLNADRMWVLPVLLVLMGGSTLTASPPKTPLAITVLAAALVVGAAAGWWRGRLTHITIDPETHELTSRTSVVGVIVIAALFGLRYGLRMLEVSNPKALPVGAGLVAEALMIFAIGMMAVQRLEMWIRCQALITEVKAAKP